MIRTNVHNMSLRQICLRSLIALMGGLACVAVANADKISDNEWQALQIVNVNELPLDSAPRFVAKSKTFFRSEKGTFIHAVWSPTWARPAP